MIIISAMIANNLKTCFFIFLHSSLVVTLLYQGSNQIHQNRKSEISIRKNIKYAIFQNRLISVLYYSCKALEVNPRSQKWFMNKIIEGV